MSCRAHEAPRGGLCREPSLRRRPCTLSQCKQEAPWVWGSLACMTFEMQGSARQHTPMPSKSGSCK